MSTPELSSCVFLNNSVESIFYQSSLSNEPCVSLSSLGCLTSGGFRRPGSSWQMPGCARGVCAVTLQGGWQATEERCEGLVQNPQYQVRMYKKSPKNIFSPPVCDEGGREFAVPRLLCKASPVQRCYIGRDNSLKCQSLLSCPQTFKALTIPFPMCVSEQNLFVTPS